MTPTARSIALLRAEGYVVGQVERLNRGAASRGVVITHDLFGFADLAAVNGVPGSGTLYVQVTAGGHGPEREAKIRSLGSARRVLLAGNRIEVHDWRRRKVRGTAVERVQVVRTEITLEALAWVR